jgi:hypothetical protein
MRTAISALFAAGLAVLPISTANAQYCSFPLEWPFCIAGAAINTAGAIVTAPFRPYYYYGPGYYYAPGYDYGSGYYYPRRHHRRHRHRY